jgi:hypothetical protein
MTIDWIPSFQDVEKTIFDKDEILRAQRLWNELHSTFVPDWRLEGSRSIIAGLFRASYGHATLELTALARALHFTWDAMTKRSVPVFTERVRGLLNETSHLKFEERVAEFEVSELLSHYVSPIAFEPYVPEMPRESRPASPDYALRLPDCDVGVEVTVLHVGKFEARDRFRKELSKRLRSITLGENLALAFDVSIPFEFDHRKAQEALRRARLAPILTSKSGELRFSVGSAEEVILKWRPMKVVVSKELPPPPNVSKELLAGDFAGAVVTGAASAFVGGALQVLPPKVTPERVEHLVLTSLQRTLRRKRKQYGQRQEPYVLIVKPGHEAIPPAGLFDFFERRLFANRLYEWITAAGIVFPRRTFDRASEENEPRLETVLNEKATANASGALRKLLSGTGRFHLRDGEFCDS